MKNKLLRRGFRIFVILLLAVTGQQLLAQTISPGCVRWGNIGTVPLNAPGSTGFDNFFMNAGDTVRVTFSLSGGTSSATVSIDAPPGTAVTATSFSSGTATLSYTIPADGNISLSAANRNIVTGDVIASSFSCTSAVTGQVVIAGLVETISEVELGFTDERINFRDAAAPIAVYSYIDSSGAGFDIYHADGSFAYRATAAQLAFVPLYDQASGIRINPFAGGGYRVTAPQYNGKTYVLEVDAPLTHIGYNSYEID